MTGNWRALTAAIALGLAITACGSSGSSSAAKSSSSSASSSAPAATGTSSSSAATGSAGSSSNTYVTNYLQYVGGKAGPANPKLSPVLIGFLNTQGGAPTQSFPQASVAATATVKYINSALGGVHGHPIKLVPCYIASSSAQALSCAQQMLATKGIDAIAYGIVDIGNPAIYSSLKGAIPIVLNVSANPADNTAPNVYELEGSDSSAYGPYGTFIKKAYPSAHTIAIAYSNQPGAVPAAEAEKASMLKAGLSVKMLPYSPTATDLIGPATQMEQADIASPQCGFVDCPLMAKAMKEISASKPALSSPLWTFLPPTAYPGGDLPQWIVGEAGANLNDPAGDPGVKAFVTTSEKYGLPAADTVNVFAAFSWSGLLVLDKVMNEIPAGKLSATAVNAKLKSFSGAVPLGPPDVHCGGTIDPSQPAVCNDETQFFQYLGHGQWKQVGGGWLKPS